jgi:REP element-mobilizing transposase RayT
MSRPIRFQGAGLSYHVMTRGNNKMRIFLDDLDYAQFLGILGTVVEDYELDSWLFCVMPNHFHLVFRTRLPNLSLAMQQLNGTYAQWWNKRHARVGHIYQGRFKAQIIEECTYLLRLCRYVLMNPVRASLVAHPWEWRWSSYHALAGTEQGCVDVPSLLRAIDPDTGETVRARLLEYVDHYADDEIANFLRRDRRVIGSEEFAARFKARARRASIEVPSRERQIGTEPLAQLLAAALQRGDGIHGGIRDAHAALYRMEDIATCAGVSLRTVQRVIGQHRSGTAGGGFLDLTPGLAGL